jgi:hypothetical protein
MHIAQIDTAAMAADPDGAGALTSGYDDEFREPVVVPPLLGSTPGTLVREETMITVPAQFEAGDFEALSMQQTGRSPDSEIKLVMHYKDLERLGLVEAATGRPTLRITDRLHAIHNIRTGVLIELIPDPPGLFCTEVQSRSFGLGPHRNILLMTFRERALSTRSVA